MPSQIFHKNKCCYIAIDKVATGSLNEAFSNIFPDVAWAPSSIASVVKKLYPDYFFFAFVRNPWDRVIRETGMTIKETGFLIGELKPQSYYFDIDYKQMDFVGRFENLRSDYEKLCEILHVSPVKLSMMHKTANKKNYRSYYNASDTARFSKMYKINETFGKDIEKFGYKF